MDFTVTKENINCLFSGIRGTSCIQSDTEYPVLNVQTTHLCSLAGQRVTEVLDQGLAVSAHLTSISVYFMEFL